MIERLKQCNSCNVRARCELFVRGEDCYIEKRFEVQVYGREKGFTNIWMAYINRSICMFGSKSEEREKIFSKRANEYWEEIKPLFKLEEKTCKTSKN